MVKYYSPPIISHTYISLSSNYPDLNLSFLRSDRECPRVSCFPDSPPFDRHGIFFEFQTEDEEEDGCAVLQSRPVIGGLIFSSNGYFYFIEQF